MEKKLYTCIAQYYIKYAKKDNFIYGYVVANNKEEAKIMFLDKLNRRDITDCSVFEEKDDIVIKY